MRNRVLALQWLLALLVVAFVGAGLWFYRVQERHLGADVRSQLESITRLKCNQIAAWRATRLSEAAVLTDGPFFTSGALRLLETGDADTTRAMVDRFTSLRRHYGYRNILLVDSAGKVRLALDPADSALHPEVLAALEQSFRSGRAVIADLHVEPGLREPHISAVAPIFAPGAATKTPAGALILVTGAREFLFPLVTSWPVPSRSAETLLVRRDGDSVLYLNDLRHQSNTALQLRIPLSRTDLPAVQAVRGRTGAFTGRDYRDVDVIASLQPVPDSPWFMVAKIDAAEAFASWRTQSTGIVAIVLLLVLLASGGVALLWLGNDKDHYRRLYESESGRRASEARYRTTLMSVGDGVIATDAEGRVRLMNPVAEALTGWTQAEADGRPLEEVFRIVNEETRQTVENPVRRVVREGVVVGLANHTVLIARDGREAPIADSGAPIRDDAGAIVGVVLVFRDQTQERNALRAMADSEARFHSLFDNMAEGVALHELVRDETGKPVNYRIVGVNAQYERILGPIGGGVPRLATEAYGTAEAPYLAEYAGAAEGRPIRFEVHFAPLDRHFDISAAPWGKDGFATIFSDITARKKIELRLQESELRFRSTLDSMMEGCQIIGPDWRYLYVNEAAARHGHYQASDLIGRTMMECYPGIEATPLFAALQRCMAERRTEQLENEFVYADGNRGWFQLGIQPVPEGLFILSIDITDRRKAEAEQARLQDQLLQAKKMESIGRLAGGVAHDFNNMLQTMLGNVELALETPGVSEPLVECLREIQQAGRHSVELTRQLLGFARKQTINPRVLALNDTVAGMMGMLRRLIGEDIELSWTPAAGLWNVRMDPFQVQQILANLAANARDAIGGVGRITIESDNVTLDESYVKTHPEATAGDYVLLAVSDTGPGISREVREHLFEPFFTTKETGRGTGLGLATIYGIVKQNRGTIGVYSEPGEGAVFKVYLPRCVEQTEPGGVAPGASDTACIAAAPRGTETILLVEDELAILRLGTRVLKKLGYTVLAADTPARALQIAAEHPGAIELLITDVVMPEMTGRELERRLLALKPGLKCLYMSGYTANVIAHRGILDKGVNFIQKPFSMEALAEQARHALTS